MKLYFSPGACSLAAHIVISELELPCTFIKVDLRLKKTEAGDDFLAINPKGQVPTLALDNGEMLTECAAMLQYLADLKPEKGLLPSAGSFERVRAQEWLNFIATEIHKNFTPLFAADRILQNPEGKEQMKDFYKKSLGAKFNLLRAHLQKNDFMLGKNFSIVDAYLYVCLTWGKFVGVELTEWPELRSYVDRVFNRPAVQKARKESK